MFGIKEYDSSHLESIKELWQKLEKGKDMTYFQSYDWNHMLVNLTPEKRGLYEIKYILLLNNNVPVMICPFWLIRKNHLMDKKGAYIIGRCGWSDYLNFIYNNELTAEELDFVLEYMKDQYGIKRVFLEQIPEGTSLYSCLSQESDFIKENGVVCVGLSLSSTIEEYKKRLSKRSKQNIRTARNRLSKAGLKIRYVFDDKPDLKLCQRMRQSRVVEKNRPKTIRQWLGHYKNEIISKLKVSFPSYLPFIEDKNSKFISAYINDQLAAWFNIGIDKQHNKVVVMAVGTNEQYSHYSPGILLMYEFITHCIENKMIRYIDFTRGDERYKFALGGVSITSTTFVWKYNNLSKGMRSLLLTCVLLGSPILINAQIPYFAKTVGNKKLYAYTSLKSRPGENNQETYTTFQYGLGDKFATGTDLYTSKGNNYLGIIARYGMTFTKWINAGVQITPSFNLSNNFKFSYLTSALYINGAISKNLFWCSNTWWNINRHSSPNFTQWTYLGYSVKTGGKSSINPMIGEIHTWKLNEDMTMAVGAYYNVSRYNIYLWSDKLFDNHPRFVVGIDATL